MQIALYIHIPFCEKKCPYCDFNSFAGYENLHDAYVDALCREMAAIAAKGREAGVSYVAQTLFFGGGTPTLLEPRQFKKMLASASRELGWHKGLETTTEANPGTVSETYLRDLLDLGINRVSLGVQSLDDAMLQRLGRIHNARQALEAFEACREAGIENVNIDLMYGLPGQSLAHWQETLCEAASLAPAHLSLYPLTIEPNTHFWQLRESGKLAFPTDDEVAEMYELAEETLAASGYEHYELSNWAKGRGRELGSPSGYRCHHNLTYWRNQHYIGLGAGAHSFVPGERYHNVASPVEYIRLVETTSEAVTFRERIHRSLEIAETLMLGLRLSEGVRRGTFLERFGFDLDQVVGNALSEAGRQELIFDDGEAVVLTERGRLLANEVFVLILDELAQKA